MVQTFGDRATFHPHVHALVTRGGWTGSGEWVPVPYVDDGVAEELFRHKVLGLLRHRGLLSQARIELLLSWRRSGFSVHNRVFAHPGDGRDFEALVRYMMRSPVSLTRLRFTPGAKEVVYARKGPIAWVALDWGWLESRVPQTTIGGATYGAASRPKVSPPLTERAGE